jgi:hypothetical protein
MRSRELTERHGARPFLQFDPAFRKIDRAPVDSRFAIPLLIASVILFASRPRADEAQWESLRALAGGQPVAVAVPARTGS